jgi:hypothetical protein
LIDEQKGKRKKREGISSRDGVSQRRHRITDLLRACPHLEIEETVHVLARVVFKEFRKLATSAEILVHRDFFGYGGFAKPSSKQAFVAHHVEKTEPSLFVFCPQVLMMQLHVGWGKGCGSTEEDSLLVPMG